MSIEANDIVKIEGETLPGLHYKTEYKVLSTYQDGQYLKLENVHPEGMLYHRKYFTFVRKAVSKFVCISSQGPNLQVGQIYEGWHNPEDHKTDYIYLTQFLGSFHKRHLMLVRNWEEAKQAFDLMHQANIENALKFTEWK